MRRIAGGLLAFVVLTTTLLVLPVAAAPVPGARPVPPSITAVDLGSVDRPLSGAAVPGSGAGFSASPALTVSRPETSPFSTVGVTWASDAAVTGVSVQLRTRKADGGWTAWTTIEQNDLQLAARPPGRDLRDGTAPYWTGDARGIEVIVRSSAGAPPREVRLQLVDPGTSAADANPGAAQPAGQAHAATATPAVYSRAQWGADETLMTWGAEYAPTITAATVHHTADSNDYSAADVPAILRSIYAYHAVSLGWGDIGYNVVVDKFGRAWEGRAGGLASTVIGGHAGGFNVGTVGISMLGNYELADPPPALIDTVAAVAAWKLSLYGVDPRGTATLISGGGATTKYAPGVPVTLPTVFAHRDVGLTVCPGRYAYSRMPAIRALVAAKVDGAAPATTRAGGPAQVLLRNTAGSGIAEWTTRRGDPGDVPLSCDWNGNGTDTVGVFRAGRFFLFDSNDTAAAPVADFWFGNSGDTPLCGDWNGDGRDTVGVWRSGVFYLRNSTTSGVADLSFAYGNPDAQPVAGDWNGDGRDTVAVYQNATFYYADSTTRPVATGMVRFGDPGDRVVAGDWTAAGRDTFGVFRAGAYYLAGSLSRSTTDQVVWFGDRSDRPLVADWDGNGTTTVGVSRGY